jgi:hypothetical protein
MGTNTMSYRLLLLAADEDDAYAWLDRHPAQAAFQVAAIVWPGRFKSLDGAGVFDRMAVTCEAYHLSAAIAACLTRVKGPDGLTPGQRLTADEVGARMRGTNG